MTYNDVYGRKSKLVCPGIAKIQVKAIITYEDGTVATLYGPLVVKSSRGGMFLPEDLVPPAIRASAKETGKIFKKITGDGIYREVGGPLPKCVEPFSRN